MAALTIVKAGVKIRHEAKFLIFLFHKNTQKASWVNFPLRESRFLWLFFKNAANLFAFQMKISMLAAIKAGGSGIAKLLCEILIQNIIFSGSKSVFLWVYIIDNVWICVFVAIGVC